MSLVGPRPPMTSEIDDRTWPTSASQGQPRHHRALAGDGRNDLPFEKMVELDRYYLENWSPSLDVSIVLRTVAVVLTRHGAY